MSGSGGSVSDAPTNKTVSGQHHQLAYITPDEAKTLVNQGGVPTMTNEGVMAYPPRGQSAQHGGSSSSSSSSSSSGQGPPGGGATSQGSGRDFAPSRSQNTGGDYDDNVKDTYSPTTNIESIHGEHDDPGSASYDPTYNVSAQELATKKAAFGSGDYAGETRWNPKTQKVERFQDYTFKEHWDNRPDAIKWSPTLSLLYAGGKNAAEFAKYKGFGFTGGSTSGGNNNTGGGGDGERARMNAVAPHAPYIVSGTTMPTESPAQKWYQSLGASSTNPSGFNLATEYAAAKLKVNNILSNSTPVGQLAVNETPYFNFLKKHNLNKGIL